VIQSEELNDERKREREGSSLQLLLSRYQLLLITKHKRQYERQYTTPRYARNGFNLSPFDPTSCFKSQSIPRSSSSTLQT